MAAEAFGVRQLLPLFSKLRSFEFTNNPSLHKKRQQLPHSKGLPPKKLF